MFISKEITSLEVKQVAYPVGPNKDAISLYSRYVTIVETGETTVFHKVYRNWHRDSHNLLFEGTAKECYDFIIALVAVEKEWVRDDRHEYVYPN